MIRHLAAIQHGARGLVLAMALPACVDHQRFHPIEKATGESPEGALAADYELETEGGIRIGETRVWSNGAEDAEVDGQDRTVVNIGFIVENETAKPITLSGSQLSLDITTTDGRTISGARPIRGGAGNTEVDPRGQKRVQVAFELTPDVEPHDIRSLRVRWQVASSDGSYQEVTSFMRTEPTYVPAGYPNYDYYWYSPALSPAYWP